MPPRPLLDVGGEGFYPGGPESAHVTQPMRWNRAGRKSSETGHKSSLGLRSHR